MMVSSRFLFTSSFLVICSFRNLYADFVLSSGWDPNGARVNHPDRHCTDKLLCEYSQDTWEKSGERYFRRGPFDGRGTGVGLGILEFE